MIKSSQQKVLDDLDKAILRALQQEGRISASELAKRVSLSVAATHTRMRRLEKEGFIRRYMAVVDQEKIGYDLLCFIHISFRLHEPKEVTRFLEEIRKLPEVLECFKVTGEYDCIVKVLVKNHRDFDRFWSDELTRIPGIARTHTAIVTHEVKTNGPVPVD